MLDRDMLTYNALDSAVTLESAGEIFREIANTDYLKTYEMTERLFPIINYMATRGILVDIERLKAERERAMQMIEERQEELDKECGRHLNPLSPKDCQAYFYIELGIQPYTKASKDAYGKRRTSITTDDKAMARLVRGTASRPGLRSAKLVQELRGLHKLKGTYLEIEFDPDGRLRCSVNPRGTRFGRLSTSQTIFGTGGNMQNLPESFKSFLVADPGCLLCEMDKAGAEWVIVAYASGDAAMIEVCESGESPHPHTANRMYGAPKPIIKRDNDLIGHSTDPDEIRELRQVFVDEGIDISNWPRNMSLRQAGKKSNHGLNYDEGYQTFALTNEMLESEAKHIIQLYHDGYPGIRQWHQYIQSKLRHDRTLINCFGRKYKFTDMWGSDLFKAAYAFIPQSTVADLLNNGLILTYNDKDPDLDQTEILMQVHDSALTQFHLDRSGRDFKKMARSLLRQKHYMSPDMTYNGRTFQIETDLKVGTTWGNMVEVRMSENVEEFAERLEAAARELSIIQ